MIQLTTPYIPGFLAFRESQFFVEKIEKLSRSQPELTPQVRVATTRLPGFCFLNYKIIAHIPGYNTRWQWDSAPSR